MDCLSTVATKYHPPVVTDPAVALPEVVPGPSDLSVAHFNVLISNRQYDKMVAKARNTGADFMSFQEVNAEWAEALENGLKSTYPYYFLLPSDSYFGMAVFSRFPLHNVETFTTRQVPNLVGDIEVGDSTIHFLAAHTYSPTKPWKYRQRNRHIEALADYLDAIDGPKIAVGDFNSVPWDHALEDFRHQTALQDSRTSWSATYPSWLSIAGIPIDYIFFSPELDCLEFRVVHDTNSDHHGIVSRFRLPAEASG
ncbi:MAG: endonuclease/exonuclease/phosphatase family protein [Bacteroidota bacterium]